MRTQDEIRAAFVARAVARAKANRRRRCVLRLLGKIVQEAAVHQSTVQGGPETRPDLPPSWPRLTVWREIVAEAEALIRLTA